MVMRVVSTQRPRGARNGAEPNARAVLRRTIGGMNMADIEPRSSMTTGEAEAWRAGYAAAKAQAFRLARSVDIPGQCGAHEAHGRMMGAYAAASAIADMEPPA